MKPKDNNCVGILYYAKNTNSAASINKEDGHNFCYSQYSRVVIYRKSLRPHGDFGN